MMHLQRTETCEITVVREDRIDAVFAAQHGDLRVEDQVAVCVGFAGGRDEEREKLRSRLHELATRSGGEALDECGCLGRRGRRVEYAAMRHDPHELGDAKYRQSPALRPLGQGGEP